MVDDVKCKGHSETVMISFLNTLVLPEIEGNFLMMIMMIMRMMMLMIYRDQQLPRYKRGFTPNAGTCSLLMLIMTIMRRRRKMMMMMMIYRGTSWGSPQARVGTCSLFTITISGENSLGGDSPLERGGGRQRRYQREEEVEGKSTKYNSYFSMKLTT